MIETLPPPQLQTGLMTAEEFCDYCAGKDVRLELVDGRVVEMPPTGPEHGNVDGRFYRRWSGYVEEQGLGETFLNTGFVLKRNPDLVRGPDEAFVSRAKMEVCPPPVRGFWPVAPDLVVEVMSPGDSPSELEEKISDYRGAGVPLIWVLYPTRREVHVYQLGEIVRVVDRTGFLDGEDVIPGLRVSLASVWP